MSKPYDATTKALLATRAADWLALLGRRPPRKVRLIDADVSTVTAMADKVLRVEEREPWLLHLELQAGRDAGLVRRTLLYNVLLEYRHDLPVLSVLVLLRPGADGPEMTGLHQRLLPDGDLCLEFKYQILRVWQLPVESVLAGGPGTLPLAPLSDVTAEALPGVLRRMNERLSREVRPAEADWLWTATFILMGLRYSRQQAAQLLQGVRAMKESTTYQGMMEEGRAEGAKRMLLLVGGQRFGSPDVATAAAIESLNDIGQLEQLGRQVEKVASWQELLASLSSPRRSGRRKKQQ